MSNNAVLLPYSAVKNDAGLLREWITWNYGKTLTSGASSAARQRATGCLLHLAVLAGISQKEAFKEIAGDYRQLLESEREELK